MTESEAYIAFNMVPGMGSVKVAALARKHGGAVAAWEAFPEKNDWRGKPVDWRSEIRRAKKMNVSIVACCDPLYPAALNGLPSKPLALYIAGKPEILSMPCVSVVGTRAPSPYGESMAARFASGLAKRGFCVVSGLAEGIDAEAHKGALSAGGSTAGVLGGALDMFFPEENRGLARRMVASGGAVASEYPFGFPPGKRTFPQRNRIVAALARCVLVVECPAHSGTLITCTFARQLGRPVMAIPANLDSKKSEGCWNLIREGAKVALSPDEVAAAAGGGAVGPAHGTLLPETETADSGASEPGLSPDEAAVLGKMAAAGTTLERLAYVTKLPAAKVFEAVTSLKLKGLAGFAPGNRVVRK